MIHCKNPADSWDWPINLLLTKDLSDWVAFGGGQCNAGRQRVGTSSMRGIELPPRKSDSPGRRTATNQELVHPHEVVRGIKEAVPLRFCALGCGQWVGVEQF
jgi:hypothetical protein